ncbi:MAG: T9SS type A sorting domain-containing protein [Bacteroidetes bacterium]|nr:T9SS type A sorting domain-containing protein [Bacteroidota bacterium]
MSLTLSAQWVGGGFTGGLMDFMDLSMPTATTAYAASATGIIKTTDGGMNWSNATYPITGFAGYSICFRTASEGVASGFNFQSNLTQIVYTNNGGTTWSLAYSTSSTGNVGRVSYAPSGVCYCTLSTGEVLQSQTNGATWSVLTTMPAPIGLIHFSSATTGYLASDSTLYKSTDAGLTWSPIYTLPGLTINDITFANDTVGYLAYYGGIAVTSDAGRHWSNTRVSATSFINHIVTVSADTAFASYSSTEVLMTWNRGQSWERQFASAFVADAIAFRAGRGIVTGLAGRYCAYTTNNGGQNGKPFAHFTYSGNVCDSTVHFENGTWSGYQMKWYYNGQLTDSSYHFDHPISIGRGYDTISLVVSNGVKADTASIQVPRITAPYTPSASRFFLTEDTSCPGSPVHVIIDTSRLNYTYTFTTDGHLSATVQGPNSGMFVPIYITDSARLVATISSTGTCTTASDSAVWEVYSPADHAVASVADTTVCGNGSVTLRVDHSSPWFYYTLTTSMGSTYDTTLRGNGGTIYLTARVTYNIYAATDYARLTTQYVRCTYTHVDTTISLHVLWPAMAFTPSDSMTYTGRTITLTNQSHADTYTWYFDTSAIRLSDTATNTSISYLTPGDKTITLVGTAHPQCPDDTIIKHILMADSAVADPTGGICLDRDIDTTAYPSGGLISYHVDRYGNSYTGGYEYCCFGGAGYNTGIGAYLRKTDKNGNLLWIKNVPYNLKNNPQYSGSYITAITSDPAGNVYIAGCYGSSISFQFGSLAVAGPGGGTNTNFFAAKIDANGNDQWICASEQSVNSEFYIGATDIKYVDDDHVYLSVLKSINTHENIYMTFPDSISPHWHEMRGLNVLQLTSRGHCVGNTMAQHIEVFNSYSNNRGNIYGIFNPLFNGTYARARNAVTGPKLYIHDDCTISMVGFFFDTLRFDGITIHGYTPILSAFMANMDPVSHTWLSAHTLYGTDLLFPETQTLSTDAYVDYLPKFDFDSHKNLYIAAHTDSIFFSDFKTFANFGNYGNLHLSSYLVLAKFDAQGSPIWHTISRDYARHHHLTGLRLSPDGSALTLTGYYSYGMNLTSTHQAPSLHLSRYPSAAYIASVDTSGDVRWINDLGQATSATSVALGTQSCSGNIYALGAYQGHTHEYRYNLYGNCLVSDTCEASYRCATASISLLSGSLPACPGDSLTVSAHPDDMASLKYLWRINGVPTGDTTSAIHFRTSISGEVVSCSVSQNDGSAIGADSLTVTLAPMAVPSITQIRDSLVASAASSYKWYVDSTYLGNTRSIAMTQNGAYTLIVTNAAGCSSSQTYIATHVGMAYANGDDGIRVYPSPNKGLFTIERGSATACTMIIDDIYGRTVYSQHLTSAIDQIDVHWLPAGIYMVGVKSDPGYRFFKILKE